MLHRFVEEWSKGKSGTTIRTYEHAIKQFEEWLQVAGTSLEEYSRSDVQQYIDYMAAQKKFAATINKVWNAIKTFSKWAGKRDAMEDDSVVKQRDVKKQAPKGLDRIERNKLFREIDRSGNKRDLAIVTVLMMTGIRVSELVALDREDAMMTERGGSLTYSSRKGEQGACFPFECRSKTSDSEVFGGTV